VAVLTYDTLSKRPGPQPNDLTGRKFGHLTAVRPTGERGPRGIVWRVECDCGTVLERCATVLTAGRRRVTQIQASCGCAGKRNRSPMYKGVGDLSSTKFRGLKASAKHRGHQFRISIQYAWDLYVAQEGHCALTGEAITLSPSRTEKGASTASLDRIDSSKGYVRGNVQWVRVEINYMKHSLSMKDFVVWCRRVASHQQD
jgi:hypothetical protein